VSRVDLTVAIMATPARAHRRAQLAKDVAPLKVTIVEDADETGDTWRQYQRCLEAGKRGTHRLVMQDDALPVADFAARARKVVWDHPDRLVCLYVPALPSTFGRAMLAGSSQGKTVVELAAASMFVPLVATVWPVKLADQCLAWPGHRRGPHGPRGRADDARIADWLKAHVPRRYALGAVPCLVDHDEDEPSTLGNGGRYPRRAAILPDTPVGELTIG
jgi:hypothetical protein